MQRDPVFQRPILSRASTAGMNCDRGIRADNSSRANSRSASDGNSSRGGIREDEAELFRAVAPVATAACSSATDLRRAGQEFSRRRNAQIAVKDFVGIEEVADDQIEAPQSNRQALSAIPRLRRRNSPGPRIRSSAPRRRKIDSRPTRRCVCNRESRDARVRKASRSSFMRRQRENEIANRAAANNEDALHL